MAAARIAEAPPTQLSRADVARPRRAVVVHSGARDAYQLARGLAETGQLEALVTDLFWKPNRPWTRALDGVLPASLRAACGQRAAPSLPGDRVRQAALRGLLSLALERSRAPRSVRRGVMRSVDRTLGRMAGRQARRQGAALVSYSYYAFDAFRAYGAAGILFQLHPHPASMRRLLLEELRTHPECAASLGQEWELALPEEDYERLCAEPAMAEHILVASSFTRRSLVENGIASEKIAVIPYGVDCTQFRPMPNRERTPGRTLRLLFVGRINQRKGVSYLVEALRLLGAAPVELTVCGRVVDDLAIFRPFADRITVRPDVSAAELREAYRQADLFLFPSVAEGFGQVLLEALASGLPILATTHTAAPDLIEDGREGFVVEPRRPDQLAERLDWALAHRRQLEEMREQARATAERFTWARFRQRTSAQVAQWMGAESATADHDHDHSHGGGGVEEAHHAL